MLDSTAAVAAERQRMNRGGACGGDVRSPLLLDSAACAQGLVGEFANSAKLREN